MANSLKQPLIYFSSLELENVRCFGERQIIADTTHHFPTTQFIATVHSPSMVQAAADANLAVLYQEGDQIVIENQPQFVKIWRVDQILSSDLFGIPVRSRQVESVIAERHALLDKTKLNKSEEKRLVALERELDSLPTTENHED